MAACPLPGKFLKTTIDQLQAALASLQKNTSAFNDLQARNTELVLALDSAESAKEAALQDAENLRKDMESNLAASARTIGKLEIKNKELMKLQTSKIQAEVLKSPARDSDAFVPNTLEAFRNERTQLKAKVLELERNQSMMAPLIKVGIAVRLGYLAQRARKLCLLRKEEAHLEELTTAGEYATQKANGNADAAMFNQSKNANYTMWSEVLKQIYIVRSVLSSAEGLDLVCRLEFRADLSVVFNGEVHVEDGSFKSSYLCKIRENYKKLPSPFKSFGGALTKEEERRKINISQNISENFRLMFWEQKKTEAKAMEEERANAEKKASELQARISLLEAQMKVLKPLVDVGVAVRKRKMTKDVYGFITRENKYLRSLGNVAAHEKDIYADAAMFLTEFETGADKFCFEKIYGRKPPSDLEELKGDLDLWNTGEGSFGVGDSRDSDVVVDTERGLSAEVQ